MTLLDIGNTTVGIYKNGKIAHVNLADFHWDDFDNCYYICVNDEVAKKLGNLETELNSQAILSAKSSKRIDLEPYFRLKTTYKGLGVDRAAGCYACDDGIIVDAGSAITVDSMRQGVHEGGFILPGLHAFLRSYAAISPRLNVQLNTQIDLEVLPNNTKDAISYGLLSAVVAPIEKFAAGRTICLTGGDSGFLVRYMKSAVARQNLVFEGMLKLISDLNL